MWGKISTFKIQLLNLITDFIPILTTVTLDFFFWRLKYCLWLKSILILQRFTFALEVLMKWLTGSSALIVTFGKCHFISHFLFCIKFIEYTETVWYCWLQGWRAILNTFWIASFPFRKYSGYIKMISWEN